MYSLLTRDKEDRTMVESLSWLFLQQLPGIHGGHDGGAGIVGVIDHLLSTVTQETVLTWGMLDGIKTLGANIHPLLLHFPIAFLFGFILIEAVGITFRKPGLRQVASSLLYLGAICSLATVASGLYASATVVHSHSVHDIMEWHERAGITVSAIAIGMALWRKFGGIPRSTMAEALSLMLSLIMGGVLFLGADMGGMMVYKHGVAVQSLQDLSASRVHQHDGTEKSAH